jgi:hypothetical protein
MFKRWRKSGEQDAVEETPRAPRPEPEFVFEGLAPWTPGSRLTRCRVGAYELDLRENATYLGYDFGAYGMLTLRWLHDATEAGPPVEQRVILEFDNLRSFIAVPGDPAARMVGETEGWDYWPGAPGRASCTVYAGESNLSFSCGGVRLRLEDV